jgi:PadR family transcriptional regulator PadR
LTTPGALRILPRNISGEMAMPQTGDLALLQGTLDVLVLKALVFGARHGYAVASWIRETSDETLHVEDRALYVALHRLEDRGWVESEWGLSENNRKAKYYQLTRAGRRRIERETREWERTSAILGKFLSGGEQSS